MSEQRMPRSPGAYMRRLSEQVGPKGLTPVLVLLAVNGLERFGNAAVTTLLPNVRDTFHISNGAAVTAVTLTAVLPALLSPFAGYLTDSVDRIRLSQISTLIVGVVAVGL